MVPNGLGLIRNVIDDSDSDLHQGTSKTDKSV